MSIRINQEKCIGCGRCEGVCPGTLICLEKKSDGTKKAKMLYQRDCWGCVSCVKECPRQAIEFFLGADIGGRGSTMTVTNEKDILHWNINKFDGTKTVIDVNRKKPNKY